MFLLVLVHRVVPDKIQRAVKWLCMHACMHVSCVVNLEKTNAIFCLVQHQVILLISETLKC